MRRCHGGSRSVARCTILALLAGACEPAMDPAVSGIRSIGTDWVAPASAPVGTVLAEPLQVRVTGESGRGIAGARVLFTVTQGYGSVQVADTVTDRDGVASAGTWTLASAPGLQEVIAHAPHQASEARATFRVMTTPAAAASMQLSTYAPSLSAGDSIQIGITFRDAFGNATTAPAVSTLSSSDTMVARVTPSGYVRAVARGLARVTASNGALSSTLAVGVRTGTPVLTVEQVTGVAGDLIAINGARTAYIASTSGTSVTRFDLATRAATGSLTLSAAVMDIAFMPNDGVLYAATSDSTVHVIDALGNVLMRSFRTPARILRLLPTPDGAWVLASTSSNAGAVLRISPLTDSIATTVVTGPQRDLAISLDGSRSYVLSANSLLHEVRIQPFGLVRSVLISNAARAIDLSKSGARILVAAMADSLELRDASDLTRLRAALPGAAALRIADTPDGHYAITINLGSPELRVLDAYTLQSYSSQSVIQPGRIAFDLIANEAWIASSAGRMFRLVIVPPP